MFEAVNVGDLQDKIVDEWTYAELLEPDVYRNRMLGHWSTFVVRSHFQELATAGISHVRWQGEYPFQGLLRKDQETRQIEL